MARKSGVVFFIMVMRSIVVGVAYYLVRDIPGLTSSFVSIFVGFLAFDMIVAMPKFSVRFGHLRDLVFLLLPRISGTALSLAGGLALGVLFGSLTKVGLPVLAGAVFAMGLSYSFSASIKGSISSYVGMISAVDMFDRVVRLTTLLITGSGFGGTGRKFDLQYLSGTFDRLAGGDCHRQLYPPLLPAAIVPSRAAPMSSRCGCVRFETCCT